MLGSVRKLNLNLEGVTKDWNAEEEVGRKATKGGAVTLGLGLQPVRDGPAGREAGEWIPGACFSIPTGSLTWTSLRPGQGEVREQEIPLM